MAPHAAPGRSRRRLLRRLWQALALAVAAGLALALLGYSYFGPSATLTYRSTAEGPLQLYVFGDNRPGIRQPALVLFHGGGWTHGSPFWLAPLGWLLSRDERRVILPEYRLAASHGTDALAALEDARAALRWVRRHAAQLGLDPEHIVAGGASAGGQLAAAAAMAPGGVPVRGLLLMAPATDTSEQALERYPRLARLFRGQGREVSPRHLVSADAPPTLVLHGSADSIIPLAASEAFCAAMSRAGGSCRTARREGASHRFFKLPWHWPWVLDQAGPFLRRLEGPSAGPAAPGAADALGRSGTAESGRPR